MTRRARRERAKNFYTFIIIAAFALAVFSINSVGKFVAEKLIAPVAEIGTEISSKSAATEKLNVSSVTFYWTGEKCSALSAASQRASEYAGEGGAGYVFEYSGAYNVISECASEKDGMPYSFTSESFNVTLSGTKSQISTVKTAFSLIGETVTEVMDLSTDLSSGKNTSLKCAAELLQIRERLENELTMLKALNSGNETVKALNDMYSGAITLLNELPASGDEEFARKLRYTAASLGCEYIRFCDNDLRG